MMQGAIEVQDLVVRYRPDLDPVLKGISFSIRGKEKVCLGVPWVGWLGRWMVVPDV